MNMPVSNQTTSVISMANIASLDVETAMMAVQSQRASLLEDQLKGQLEDVQRRNAQIALLNEALSGARNLQARFKGDAKAQDKIGKLVDNEKKDIHKAEQKAALAGKSILSPEYFTALNNVRSKDSIPDSATATGGMVQEMQRAANAAGVTINVSNKGELDKAVENLKSLIDSQSNSQQMDMLRLQSLSNKRNEAFDLMTNFVKKMQESRSSIIGNMR